MVTRRELRFGSSCVIRHRPSVSARMMIGGSQVAVPGRVPYRPRFVAFVPSIASRFAQISLLVLSKPMPNAALSARSGDRASVMSRSAATSSTRTSTSEMPRRT